MLQTDVMAEGALCLIEPQNQAFREVRLRGHMDSEPSLSWQPALLGRTERSSPKAAQRRAAGAGLDGEGADQAIITAAVMSA
jgi:hypothetical protein